MTDNDFGITFVLPVAGASIEEEGGQSLSVSLVHRILEVMYVYLGAKRQKGWAMYMLGPMMA